MPPGGAPYVTLPYLDRMDLAYAAADFAICRSGAMTCAELTAVGLPAVYVPLPHGNGEQRLNAVPVAAAGGGLILADAELTPDWIRSDLLPILTDAQLVAAMSQAAAGIGHRDTDVRMAAEVLGLIRGGPGGAGRGGRGQHGAGHGHGDSRGHGEGRGHGDGRGRHGGGRAAGYDEPAVPPGAGYAEPGRYDDPRLPGAGYQAPAGYDDPRPPGPGYPPPGRYDDPAGGGWYDGPQAPDGRYDEPRAPGGGSRRAGGRGRRRA
jgi:Glycosyltransferase family 28 C-terminal domain